MSDIPEADRSEGSAHPRDVYDLLGHQKAEQVFLQSIASGRMHHAWLITGAAGVGKATLAYRFIRYLLGGRGLLGDLDVPESDPVAGRIAAQGHGNLRVVRRPYDPKTKKIKSEIPVAEMRRLSEFFRETASETGKPRIGLIDKADELNVSSENAVLKLLEEPPENGVLFLLADQPGRLLPTIRSRCFQLDLRGVPDADLTPWLGRRSDADAKTLAAAVWFSRGAPGRALALLAARESVLSPVTGFAGSLGSGGSSRDMGLVGRLSGVKVAGERALFWGAMQDLLVAYARHAAGEAWSAPFPAPSKAADWQALYGEAVARERLEAEINMEQRASLLDFLSDVRAA